MRLLAALCCFALSGLSLLAADPAPATFGYVLQADALALIIPQNGSQLLVHADFVATIDAIGIEDLFTEGNKVQSKVHTSEVLGHLKTMTGAGKPALVIEYPKTAARRTLAKKLAHENGLVWLITDRQLKTLGISGR